MEGVRCGACTLWGSNAEAVCGCDCDVPCLTVSPAPEEPHSSQHVFDCISGSRRLQGQSMQDIEKSGGKSWLHTTCELVAPFIVDGQKETNQVGTSVSLNV